MKKITFLLFTFLSVSLFGQIKLTSSLSESFNGTSWSDSSEIDYEYDANGNLTKKTEGVNYQYVYSYNASNKLKEESYYQWNFSTNTFELRDKSNYTYNSNGFLIETVIDNSKDNFKGVYGYDSNNRLNSFVQYVWTGDSWEKDSEGTATYNSNNQIINTVTIGWQDKNATVWGDVSRSFYTYNSNNKLIENIFQEWSSDTNSLENNYKSEYEYDTNGNRIQEKGYSIENGSWISEWEEIYNYDTSQLMSSFIHPFKDKTGLEHYISGNPHINKLISSNNETNDYRTTYNYGESTASVNDFNLIDFSVYPNPTTSIIKIDDSSFSIKNVELYSVIGKKVITSTKNKLNLQHLVNGVYLLKIETESGKFATKRIIKN